MPGFGFILGLVGCNAANPEKKFNIRKQSNEFLGINSGLLANDNSQLNKDKECLSYAEAMSNKVGEEHIVYRIFYSQSLGKCLYAYQTTSPMDEKDEDNSEKTIYYFAVRDEITFEPIFEKTFYGFERTVYRYMSTGDFEAKINEFK